MTEPSIHPTQPISPTIPHPTGAEMVDVDVPRFNQAIIALATALAFIVRQPWLVAAVFVVLLASVSGSRWAILSRLYVGLIRPRLRPNGPVELEPGAAPRFAQKIGAGVLGVAVLAFVVGAEPLGWAATLTVTTLAALAATTRICVGCMIHDRLVSR